MVRMNLFNEPSNGSQMRSVIGRWDRPTRRAERRTAQMSIAGKPRKRAVILVLVHKPSMNPDEVLSLRQCISILGAHDIVVVCPADMNVAAYKEISTAISFCQIHPWWQSSYRNFNRLKISPLLYWKFR